MMKTPIRDVDPEMLERELKLLISRKDCALVAQSACVVRALETPFKRKRVRNIYFDTPDAGLRQRGMELRVRRIDGRWIQTVKIRREGEAAVHQREEIETPVPRPQPDLPALKAGGVPEDFFSAIGSGALESVFETRYWRRSAMLKLPGNCAIELSVDSGEAQAGDEARPISEIELELKRGEITALYRFAEELAEGVDLRINPRTKPDLGYGMLLEETPAAVFDRRRQICRGESAEDVLERFLSECSRHAFANERAILETDNIEGVHQMRVGLRRFRACLSLFKPLVPSKAVTPAGALIAPLLQALGPARDWDVFIRDRIDRFAGSGETNAAMAKLRLLAVVHREKAYAELRERLATKEHHRDELTLLSWIARRGWRDAMSSKRLRKLEQPIDDFVKEALQRTRRKTLDRGRGFRRLAPKELHKLRIVLKKHRYPVDFFAESFPGKRGSNYGAALKTLQTELGRVNDVTVARELSEELQPSPGLQPAVAALLARAEKDRRRSFERLPDCWSAFRKQRAFWKRDLLDG